MSIMKAKFVRSFNPFKEESERIFQELNRAFNNDTVGYYSFLDDVIGNSLNPHITHNSNTDFNFYNKLFNSICDNLQDSTVLKIQMLCSLSYLESIEYAGMKPIFKFDPMFDNYRLIDVEPVFNVWVEAEGVVERTLAFRFSVNNVGELEFNPVNYEFLASIQRDAMIALDEAGLRDNDLVVAKAKGKMKEATKKTKRVANV